MTSLGAESSCRRARPASWPLVDVRRADTRVAVHPPVGGCTTSTDRDCGAIVDEKEHCFAVVGDSVR